MMPRSAPKTGWWGYAYQWDARFGEGKQWRTRFGGDGGGLEGPKARWWRGRPAVIWTGPEGGGVETGR